MFKADPEVIRYASIRLHTALMFQWLASSYEISGAYMRGLGYSVLPMVLTIFGTCVLRLVWVYTVHPVYNDFHVLMLVYPVSWVITGTAAAKECGMPLSTFRYRAKTYERGKLL